MKKILALILALSMMFALAACGGGGEQASGDYDTREVEPGLQIYAEGEYLADKIAIGCSGAGTTLSPHGKPDWGSVAVVVVPVHGVDVDVPRPEAFPQAPL